MVLRAQVMQDQKHTAKTFQPHLLAALAELTSFQALRAVPMGDVLPVVLKQAGVEADELGEKSGKLVTTTLIGQAFRALRTLKEPLTVSPRKGAWALTESGIAELQRTRTTANPNVVLRNVEVQEAKQIDPYHDDPYIRKLAINRSKCFGQLYEPANSVCKGCPLNSHCGEAFYDLCAQAADPDDVPAPEQSNVQAKSADGSAEAMEFEQSEGVESPTERKQLDRLEKTTLTKSQIQSAARIQAQNNPLCQGCWTSIPTGEWCMFGAQIGAFHSTCFKTVKKNSQGE